MTDRARTAWQRYRYATCTCYMVKCLQPPPRQPYTSASRVRATRAIPVPVPASTSISHPVPPQRLKLDGQPATAPGRGTRRSRRRRRARAFEPGGESRTRRRPGSAHASILSPLLRLDRFVVVSFVLGVGAGRRGWMRQESKVRVRVRVRVRAVG
jgi:hypothetical protein